MRPSQSTKMRRKWRSSSPSDVHSLFANWPWLDRFVDASNRKRSVPPLNAAVDRLGRGAATRRKSPGQTMSGDATEYFGITCYVEVIINQDELACCDKPPGERDQQECEDVSPI